MFAANPILALGSLIEILSETENDKSTLSQNKATRVLTWSHHRSLGKVTDTCMIYCLFFPHSAKISEGLQVYVSALMACFVPSLGVNIHPRR